MPSQKGYGLCGICLEQIEEPTPPLRHFRGNQMAHKRCVDAREAYERTDEYKVEQARKKLQSATNKFNVAYNDLMTAERELRELVGDVQP